MSLPGISAKVAPEEKRELPLRLGTPIEKNVLMSEEKLEAMERDLRTKFQTYSVYPDIWCDEVLIPTNSSFHLMFYQRIMMRNLARVPLNHITAARGVSKTFITLFMAFHRCIFCPGTNIAFAAPGKSQSAQIGRQTVNDLLVRFPLLNNELDGPVVGDGKSYFEVRFKNKSKIEVTAALESTRGRRFDAIDVDEARDHIGDNVNAILVPTVSKMRTTTAGVLNPFEMHQMQTYTTSASSKSCYNYEKVLDIMCRMIINPKNAAVLGFDYRVPVIEGIYPASYIQGMRLDPTFNENAFAREYLSIYTAENDESWFNFNKLNQHRKIVNAEWEAHLPKDNPDAYYLISIDVGRLNDLTAVTVFKVLPRDGKHHAKVVNIFVLGRTSKTKQMYRQVIDMKRIIRAFKPKEVVVDVNGLG